MSITGLKSSAETNKFSSTGAPKTPAFMLTARGAARQIVPLESRRGLFAGGLGSMIVGVGCAAALGFEGLKAAGVAAGIAIGVFAIFAFIYYSINTPSKLPEGVEMFPIAKAVEMSTENEELPFEDEDEKLSSVAGRVDKVVQPNIGEVRESSRTEAVKDVSSRTKEVVDHLEAAAREEKGGRNNARLALKAANRVMEDLQRLIIKIAIEQGDFNAPFQKMEDVICEYRSANGELVMDRNLRDLILFGKTDILDTVLPTNRIALDDIKGGVLIGINEIIGEMIPVKFHENISQLGLDKALDELNAQLTALDQLNEVLNKEGREIRFKSADIRKKITEEFRYNEENSKKFDELVSCIVAGLLEQPNQGWMSEVISDLVLKLQSVLEFNDKEALIKQFDVKVREKYKEQKNEREKNLQEKVLAEERAIIDAEIAAERAIIAAERAIIEQKIKDEFRTAQANRRVHQRELIINLQMQNSLLEEFLVKQSLNSAQHLEVLLSFFGEESEIDIDKVVPEIKGLHKSIKQILEEIKILDEKIGNFKVKLAESQTAINTLMKTAEKNEISLEDSESEYYKNVERGNDLLAQNRELKHQNGAFGAFMKLALATARAESSKYATEESMVMGSEGVATDKEIDFFGDAVYMEEGVVFESKSGRKESDTREVHFEDDVESVPFDRNPKV